MNRIFTESGSKYRDAIITVLLAALIVLTLSAVIVRFAGTDVDAATLSVKNATGYVNSTGGAFVRKSTSTTSSKVAELNNNKKITIIKEIFTSKTSTKATTRWYYIQSGTKKGYIRSDLVDNISYTAVAAKTTDALNYRVGAGSDMTRVGTLDEGDSIKVLLKASAKGSSTTWYKIKVGSNDYYACSTWIQLGSESSSASTSAKTSILKSGLTLPTSLFTGQSFSLAGVISSNKTISSVRVGVKNSSGNWVLSTTKTLGKTSIFNIATVDSSIKFGTLDAGSYYYVVNIKIAGETKYTKVVTKSFTVKKGGTGAQKLANMAVQLAWPLGTSASTYDYNVDEGGPTSEFKAALNQYYPDRSSWGAAPKVGASCDVFIGTVCRASGYDSEMPRTLESQWTHIAGSSLWQCVYSATSSSEFSSNPLEPSDLQAGDVILYSKTNGGKHICMFVKVDGQGCISEAAYQDYYGRLAVAKFTSDNASSNNKVYRWSNKTKLEVYRALA